MTPGSIQYKDKIITADAAAKLVKSGQMVRFHIGRPPIPILERWQNATVSYRM
jgi:hypothetical protein